MCIHSTSNHIAQLNQQITLRNLRDITIIRNPRRTTTIRNPGHITTIRNPSHTTTNTQPLTCPASIITLLIVTFRNPMSPWVALGLQNEEVLRRKTDTEEHRSIIHLLDPARR